jgi:xylulokinase
MNYVGIDIGSSCCKALVINEEGKLLANSQRDYDIIFSKDGSATLDSEIVIKSCFEVIKECGSRVESGSIKAIGISSQGEAFTAIGDNGEILNKAKVSSDSSSRKFIKEWIDNFGEEKLYQITGHTAYPIFTLFKLLWFKNNQQDLWKKSKYFFCFEDLLQFRLGLKPAISWSLAGRTMMFDVNNHKWNQEILDQIGISTEQLSNPLPPGSNAGIVKKEIANQLGLTENVIVVTGGHDQTCSALGAGVINEGAAMLGSGTVECICPAFNRPIFSQELKKYNLCTYNYSIKNLYTTVAYSLTGGNIIKWFKEQLGYQEIEESKHSGEDVYDLLIGDLDSIPSNLLALPYFTPSGTPYFDDQTKGAIVGLRLSTKRKEILKALLEGVSFEMRLNLEILEHAGYTIDELRWVGGGSKSKLLAQLKANVMNKRITLLNVKEAGCFGAAMLACSADTWESVHNLALKWVKVMSVVYPQKEYVNWYDEKFELYKKLYQNIKSLGI